MSNEELLGRIEERLISLSEVQSKTYEQVQRTNGRVSSLERWRAYLVGGGIVIITIVGWLVQTK